MHVAAPELQDSIMSRAYRNRDVCNSMNNVKKMRCIAAQKLSSTPLRSCLCGLKEVVVHLYFFYLVLQSISFKILTKRHL